MSTLFTRILNGEIPGRFVWREPDVSAFLTTGKPRQVSDRATQFLRRRIDFQAA